MSFLPWHGTRNCAWEQASKTTTMMKPKLGREIAQDKNLHEGLHTVIAAPHSRSRATKLYAEFPFFMRAAASGQKRETYIKTFLLFHGKGVVLFQMFTQSS